MGPKTEEDMVKKVPVKDPTKPQAKKLEKTENVSEETTEPNLQDFVKDLSNF